MRLLKIPYLPGQEKLELIQEWGENVPPYAILSHRWSDVPDDEVLFADVQNGTSESKPAFSKVKKAMNQAKLHGYGFLWIDTCCIDKNSSVELSEAINSMYSYYEHAGICYAFLSDVSGTDMHKEFESSKWWERGWTLQELLAPSDVEFFSKNWARLGSKKQLHPLISQKTGIDGEYLFGARPVQDASIAKRMSWAASRKTTREEDLAYCLIGIFNVNMFMLYGEGGKRAFVRLQEEIMRSSEDQSLFAWISAGSAEDKLDDYHGLLADSPKDFKLTGNTIPYGASLVHTPSTMTARGLHITLPLTQKGDQTSIAVLQCPVPARGNNDWLAIYLVPLSPGSNQYARVRCGKLASISEQGKLQEVYVRQVFQTHRVQTIYPHHFFQLRGLRVISVAHSSDLEEYKMVAEEHAMAPGHASHFPVVARQPWSTVPLVYKINKTPGALTAAILVSRTFDGESFVLMLGSTSEFEVGFDVWEGDQLGSLKQMEDDFSPRPPGEEVPLGFHKVRVKVQEDVRPGRKIYLVDLEVEPVGRPTRITEVLHDAVDRITNPMNNQTQTNKGGFRSKVKRLWTGDAVDQNVPTR